MFEDTKALLGIGGRYRRYVNAEDITDLEEISDPRTTEDETATSWRSVIADHWIATLGIGFFLVVVLGLVLYYFSRFVPIIIHNQYVQGGLLVTALLIGGMKVGWSRRRSVVEQRDRLNLKLDDGVLPFIGVYVRTGERSDAFLPFKGFGTAGQRPRPYTVGDLSVQLPQQMSNVGLSDDAPALISLHPEFTEHTTTEYGNVAVCRSGELVANTEGDTTTLRTTIPERSEGEMTKMANRMERMAEENNRLRDEKEKWQRAHDELLSALDEPVEKRVDTVLMHLKELQMTRSGKRIDGSTDGESEDGFDFVGTGATALPASNGSPANDEAIEDVEDEVSDDDE